MLPTSASAELRATLADRLSRMLDELQPLLEQHVAGRSAEARGRGRHETSEQLNQAVRRIRQAEDCEEVAAALVDAVATFAGAVAVFRLGSGMATGLRIRGVDEEAAERFAGLEIPLDAAPAFMTAVETLDPVVAMCTAAELSARVTSIIGEDEAARVTILPAGHDGEVWVLVCCWGGVQTAAVELLAQVAGLRLALDARPEPVPEPEPEPEPAPPELISIELPAQAPVPSVVSGARPDWDQLSPEDQQLHLRALRFARVQVSELRLFQAEIVHAARMHRDIYGALCDDIDRARERYRREFLTSPTMVDYLHLEIVRTLAHDNPGLLGTEYPGPLV